MTSLEQHFTRFLEHRQWLGNVTGKTVSWYAQTFKLLLRLQPDLTEPAQLTKVTLQTVVVKMRARGLCPESCNTPLCPTTRSTVPRRDRAEVGGRSSKSERRLPI